MFATFAWAPRPTRFPLALSVRFRCGSSAAWQSGQTLNVSATGLLVQSSTAPPAEADPIELVLGLAEQLHSRSDVTCLGRVVRVADKAGGAALFAASIDLYRFAGRGWSAAVQAPAAADEGVQS